MSILTPTRRAVKLYPLAPSKRRDRPFGEGLDEPRPTILVIKAIRYEATVLQGDDSTAVVRLVKLAGKGEVYDVSRGADGLIRCDCPDYEFSKAGTSSLCKHGTACVEAGLIEAPAPVANPGPVNRVGHLLPRAVPVAKIEPVATPEPKPARTWTDAQWRRAEYFHLQPPAGMKRPIAAKAPAPAAAPVVKPSGVEKLDAAWHLGYCLGSDGVNAAPSTRWAADMKASFLDGFAWGEQQRDADLEATVAMYREMEMADMPSHFAECYA